MRVTQTSAHTHSPSSLLEEETSPHTNSLSSLLEEEGSCPLGQRLLGLQEGSIVFRDGTVFLGHFSQDLSWRKGKLYLSAM